MVCTAARMALRRRLRHGCRRRCSAACNVSVISSPTLLFWVISGEILLRIRKSQISPMACQLVFCQLLVRKPGAHLLVGDDTVV